MATSQKPSIERKHIFGTRRYVPDRSMGESEARIIPTMSDNPLAAARGQLPVGVSVRDLLVIERDGDELNSTEYYTRRLQLSTTLIIEHNWHEALHKAISDVKDSEVALPFELCHVKLAYLGDGTIIGFVTQDPETHQITVQSVGVGESLLQTPLPEVADEFKKHLLYALIAMELGLTKNEPASLTDLGLSSVKTGPMSNIFKVVAIRRQKAADDHNVNTGRMGQRWHLRRSHWKMVKGVRKRIKWYAAGNIDLGIIVKDYTLDDLKN